MSIQVGSFVTVKGKDKSDVWQVVGISSVVVENAGGMVGTDYADAYCLTTDQAAIDAFVQKRRARLEKDVSKAQTTLDEFNALVARGTGSSSQAK